MAKHFWETAVLLENMHCTHDCHALESVSFSSSMPLPLAMSLAPRHFPHTSPRPSHLATPPSQCYFYLPASHLSTRDARAVTFCGVHGQGLGKISRSKKYRLGTSPPRAGPRFQGGLYHSTSKKAFIGLLVTYICSSIGLFTAVT